MNQALNKRLGTKGLNMAGIANAAGLKNMTVEEVIAMPEIDGWEYEGIEPRDGKAYVCSTYVIGAYKAAGVFGKMEFNPGEQTPKDLYSLNIFETSHSHKSKRCSEIDPNQAYCQFLGRYRMTFPGYSSIKPYAHMNEKCPSIAPKYDRPNGC